MLEFENRPWGRFDVLLDDPICKVKKITVKPGARLSYQRHQKRTEHWTIVQGVALVTLNDIDLVFDEGDTVFIEQGTKHRVANEGEIDLIFIETQTGTYFGEDDIERFSDDYGRV